MTKPGYFALAENSGFGRRANRFLFPHTAGCLRLIFLSWVFAFRCFVFRIPPIASIFKEPQEQIKYNSFAENSQNINAPDKYFFF